MADDKGVVLGPAPVERVTGASGESVDPLAAFRHVVGNVWEVRVRLYNETRPTNLNGRVVRTLIAHVGQRISGEERRQLASQMARH